MALTDDHTYKRAIKLQAYEDFCKYAKAPPLRRSIAALIDVAIVGTPAMYEFVTSGSYLAGAPILIYFLVRDCLIYGKSIGKWVTGLVVVHPETFAPCTLRQSLIRNIFYAAICPIFLIAGIAWIGWAGLIFSTTFFILLVSRVNLLFFIGYDTDTGRTIPDCWAETHVLTPAEIATIRKLRFELDQMA